MDNYSINLIKKIDKIPGIERQNKIESLKWLSFFELGNIDDILYFIKCCTGEDNNRYNKEELEKIVDNNKYLSYILYKKDKPIAYIIGYIKEQKNSENKILQLEDLELLPDFEEIRYKEIIIKDIISKAKTRNINIVKISVDDNDMLEMLKNHGFKKER